jgi:SulP family sulfate permease
MSDSYGAPAPESSPLHNLEVMPESQIQAILQHLDSIVRSIDPQVAAARLDELHATWNGIVAQTRSSLASHLSHTTDTVIIQHQLHQAKHQIIDQCLHSITQAYSDRDVTNLIGSLRELRSLPLGPSEPPADVSVQSVHSEKPWWNPWAKNWRRYIPILQWLPRYSFRHDLFGDLQAGLTVAFLVIPQALSYATLAGLPPVYGLYAAWIAPLIYMIFGSSNEISVGPVSMVSLTLTSVLGGLATAGSSEYITLAVTMTLISGGILLLLGLCRLGFLVENLISHPTMLGFTQGAATLIILSQMKGLLNITIAGSAKTLIDYAIQIHDNQDQFSWRTTVMGVGAIILIVGARLIHRRIPMAFLVLVIGTVLGGVLHLDKHGIPLVGPIPRGIHVIDSVRVPEHGRGSFFIGTILIVVLGFMESISVGRRLAQLRHYRLDANAELVALGLSNLVGGIFRSYPVTGSVSRSSENYWNNARTRAHNLIVFVVLLVALLAATPLFKWTPKCILAAVVIAAAASLIEWKMTEARFLWKIREYLDLLQIGVVWLAVLLLGPEIGVVFAIAVTMVQVVFRAARPAIVPLGRLPETFVYKNAERYPQAITIPGVLIVRVDARLAFYNVAWFQDRLAKLDRGVNILRTVIIDASGINTLDSTSIHTLDEIIASYLDRQIPLLWAEVKGPVRDLMDRSGLTEKIGHRHFFLTLQDAVDFVTHPAA